ncbi:MAG: TadA family conjugal transfer-associated ATPase, partial [Propionibacteriaceae bacterium]
LAARLAAGVGRRLDDACPYVDARLADGTRLHAVLSPVAEPGTSISLRVPARRHLSLDEWVRLGFMPEPIAAVLQRIIDRKLAFLISGGTGTGKTTLLATLLASVPAQERLLVVEDSRELNPRHPHVVWLEGRPANAEGSGAITLSTLVKQALRMRPDRVVVGEVRGAEVVDLLAALNTGHEGGCGTVHANSARDVPSRLEALAALAGLGREALHAQLASALSVVIHIRRGIDGLRRVEQIHTLARNDQGYVEAVPALTWSAGKIVVGPGAQRLDEVMG